MVPTRPTRGTVGLLTAACNCWQTAATRRLRVEFRGAGGFGKSFMERGWREWGGKSQQDLVDLAHWAVDQRIAQPEKIGIWGWSFGGFSAFATLTFYPDEFACGVAMYGLSDLELFARARACCGATQRCAWAIPGLPTGSSCYAASRRYTPPSA